MTRYEFQLKDFKPGDRVRIIKNEKAFNDINLDSDSFHDCFEGKIAYEDMEYGKAFGKSSKIIPSNDQCYQVRNEGRYTWDWTIPACLMERIL